VNETGSVAAGHVVGGRFKIERLLGKGGMGEVYAARHVTTGREVAIKMIRGEGEEQRRRFLREAKTATAIEHPNVIEVYDVFEDEDGTPVMVMELLHGETFAAYRERAGALRVHEAAAVLLPVIDALMTAHAKGIVHRDLKPDNVFLAVPRKGGAKVPKLLDFGIAKVLDPASLETQGGQTNTGSLLGTPHYMAFEQAMSEKVIDTRTDVWAMGVIVFEALCGRRPLEFNSLGQMYVAFLQTSVPSIRDVVTGLPKDLADVLDRCLQKRREDRLEKLDPLHQVLSRYLDPKVPGANAGGGVVPALPATPTDTASAMSTSVRPRRSRLAVGTAALIVLALGGITAAFFATRGGRPPGTATATAPPPPTISATAPETMTVAAPPPPTVTPTVASVQPSATASTRPKIHLVGAPGPSVSVQPSVTASTPAPQKGIVEKLPY
jgi:serine/threonine-protein kinase